MDSMSSFRSGLGVRAAPRNALVATTEARIAGSPHLPHEVRQTHSAEGRREGEDLVEGAAHRPHVRFGVVAHALHHFRCDVERRANGCLRQVLRELEDARNAEVAHLDVAFLQ